MIIELINCTTTLLNEIANPEMKRNDVALTYSFALKSSDKTDWARVNNAIIRRWSMSALEYIKNRAHRIASGKLRVDGRGNSLEPVRL